MTAIRFTITGYLVGSIWWPAGSECWKDLRYDCSAADARSSEPLTLREHLLRLTNDGDFSSCSVAQGELVGELTVYSEGRRRTVERRWPLSRFPSIADMIHPDPDWWPDYGEDDLAA